MMPLWQVGTVFNINHLNHLKMELKELNREEQIAIYGGNQLSESLLYYAGAICKGIYNFYSMPYDGGYSLAKCGY